MKLIIVAILSLVLLKFVDFGSISGFDLSLAVIPYGVAIFALAGISAVPEMNEELKNRKFMFKAILLGMVITFVVELLFVIPHSKSSCA